MDMSLMEPGIRFVIFDTFYCDVAEKVQNLETICFLSVNIAGKSGTLSSPDLGGYWCG